MTPNEQHETRSIDPRRPAPYMMEDEDEISLLDLLLVLARRKRLIFWTTTLFAVAAIVASLLMTPVFSASVRFLNPVAKSGVAAMIEAQAGALAGLLPGGLGKDSNPYMAMLKSRTMQERIMDRFAPPDWRDLVGPGKEMRFQQLVEEQIGEMNVTEDTKEGSVSVAVNHTDQFLVAEIAASWVQELERMANEFAFREASVKRKHIETELANARKGLSEAEAKLREYQERTGIYVGEAQLSANIENRVKMRAEITAREIRLRSLRSYATSQNPEVVKLEKEIAGLKEEMARLESVAGAGDPLNPVGGMPAAIFEYGELLRDWKFQETLYNTLLRNYETARMSEEYSPVLIQVLDPAQTPELRSKPRRTLIVILATFLGGFVSIFLAFLAEFWKRASEDPEQAEKVREFRESLGLHKIFRRRNRSAG